MSTMEPEWIEWTSCLLNWVNCIVEEPVDDASKLADESVLSCLIKHLTNDRERAVDEFLRREYPHFERSKRTPVVSLVSLLLHYACIKVNDPAVREVMCRRLGIADQRAIARFADRLMRRETVTERGLVDAIDAVSRPEKTSTPLKAFSPLPPATPVAPATPTARTSQKFFHLEAELAAERFDRNYLQEEVSRNQRRIAQLESVLKSHIGEINRLKQELILSQQDELKDNGDCAQCASKEKRLQEQLRSHEVEILRTIANATGAEEERDSIKIKINRAEKDVEMWRSRALEFDAKLDSLNSQVDDYKLQIDTLTTALEDTTRCLNEYRQSHLLNASVESDDEGHSIRKLLNTSLNATPENLGKAVVDVQLKEQLTKNFTLLEQIDNLKKENRTAIQKLTDVENSKKKLMDAHRKLNLQLHNVVESNEMENKSYQAKIAMLQTEINDTLRKEASLNEEISKLRSENNADKLMLESLNSNLSLFMKEKEDLIENNQKISSLLSTKIDLIKVLEENIFSIKTDHEKILLENKHNVGVIENQKNMIQQLENEKEMQKNFFESEKCLFNEEKQNLVNNQNVCIEQYELEKITMKNEINTLLDQNKECYNEIHEKNLRIIDNEQQMVAYQNEYEKISGILDEKHNLLNSQNIMINDKNHVIEKHEIKISSLLNENENLSQKTAEGIEKIKQLEDQNQKLITNSLDISKDNKRLQFEIDDQYESIIQSQMRITAFQDQIQSLCVCNDSKDARIRSLEESIKAAEEAKNSLSSYIKQLEVDMQEVQNKLENTLQTCEENSKLNMDQQSVIEKYEKEINAVNQECKSLLDDNKEKLNIIQKLNDDINQNKEKLLEVEKGFEETFEKQSSHMKQLEMNIQEMQIKYENTLQTCEDNSKLIMDQQSIIEKYEKEITTLNQEYKSLLDDNKEKLNIIQSLHDDIIENKEKLLEVENGFQETFEKQSSYIKQLEVDMQEVQNKLENTLQTCEENSKLNMDQQSVIEKYEKEITAVNQECKSLLDENKEKLKIIQELNDDINQNKEKLLEVEKGFEETFEKQSSHMKQLEMNIQEMQIKYENTLQTCEDNSKLIMDQQSIIEKYEKEITTLNQEYKSLLDDNKEKLNMIQELNGDIVKNKENFAEIERKYSEIQKENELSQQLIDELKNVIVKSEERAHDFEIRYDEMNHQENMHIEIIQKLTAQIKQCEQDTISINTINESLSRQHKDNLDLISKQINLIEQSKLDIAAVREENSILSRSNGERNILISNQSDEINETKQLLLSTQEKNEKLLIQIREYQTKIQDVEIANKQTKEKFNENDILLEKYKEEITLLQNENEIMVNEKNSNINKLLSSIKDLKNEVALLNEKNEKLTDNITLMKEKENSIDEYKNEIAILKQQYENSVAQQKENVIEIADLRATIGDLVEEKLSIMRDNETIHNENEERHKTISNQEACIDKLNSEITLLGERNVEIMNEKENIIIETNKMIEDLKCKSLETENQQLDKIKHLSDIAKKSEQENKTILEQNSQHEVEIELIKQQLQSHKEDHETLIFKNNEFDDMILKKNEEIEILRKQLFTIKDDYKINLVQIEETHKQIIYELKQEIVTIKDEVNFEKQNNSELTKEMKKKEEQIVSLTEKLDDVNMRIYTENVKPLVDYDTMLQEKVRLCAELEKKESELKAMKEAHEVLLKSRQLPALDQKDANRLVSDLRNEYEDKLTRMKQKMKQLYQEQIALNADQQREEMAEYRDRQKREMAELETSCKKYSDKIKSYEAHVNQLSSELWKIGEKLLMAKNEKDYYKMELKNYKGSIQSLNLVPQSKADQSIIERPHTIPDRNASNIVSHGKASAASVEIKRRQFKVPDPIDAESGGLHMSDEEGEMFDNRYLNELKSGADIRMMNSTMRNSILQPNRLSELQWRNSLCLPHLKSSYPAEMQFQQFKESDIKAVHLDDTITAKSSRPKKEVGQTSYKKPGPPTPSKKGGRQSLQGGDSREPLKEQNENVSKKAATPSRIKSFFTGNNSRSSSRDENTFGTPKGKRMSIFRKPR